ncbi:glycosyltransferase [Echinimonas agarilytica]|uniref:Glycosyltransferase n=1 Tax=Echinimonas agarilytica TaxID=1215918 RepID=A0AA41WCY1_9GAMM|nr:glycosyltransferase [Echinimonas agarilytica]MCM2681494.1 glycosyltransferase [Echinimonas agarilytica]
MKVLIVGNRYSSNMDVLNNPEYRTFKIAQAFKDNGIDCQTWLINYKSAGDEECPEGQYFSPSARTLNLPKVRQQLNRRLQQFQPTHVWFTNGPIVGLVARILCPALLKTRVIYEVLDNYATYYPQWLVPFSAFDRHIRRNSELCLYVTQELLDADSIAQKAQFVFPNGYEPALFKPQDQQVCRQRLNLKSNAYCVGYTGSLDVRVNDNLSHILNHAKETNIEFVVASNSEPPEWLLNNKKVTWLGGKKISEVPEVINACDLMLIPNRQDDFTQFCFPSKLLEYMGCGKPFLITPINQLNGMVPAHFISSFDMSQYTQDILAAEKASYCAVDCSQYTWKGMVEGVITRLKKIS